MTSTYDMDVAEQGGACLNCGVPGGYPYCASGPYPTCADVASDDAEPADQTSEDQS